jgi:hypothetical protein
MTDLFFLKTTWKLVFLTYSALTVSPPVFLNSGGNSNLDFRGSFHHSSYFFIFNCFGDGIYLAV